MQSFESKGYWWLPENRESEISGTLICNPTDKIRLELMGSFHEPSSSHESRFAKLIHGVVDRKLITLCDCRSVGYTHSNPGYTTVSYSPSTVLIGHLFEKPEDIKFFKLRFALTYLEDWMSRDVFQVDYRWSQDEKTMLGANIVHTVPDFPTWTVEGAQITIEPESYVNHDWIKELRIGNRLHFVFSPTEPVSLDNYFDKRGFLLQDFLTFAMGYPVVPIRIEGKSYAAKREDIDPDNPYPYIEIIYRHRDVPVDDRFSMREYMLFSFEDVKDDVGRLLDNWFARFELLRPVYDLYLSVLQTPHVFQTHHFLNLAQAVESYHRRSFGGSYRENWTESELFKYFVSLIPKNIDNGFRDSIEQKMKYLNEYSLRKRLREILEHCGSTVSYFIPNQTEFVESVLETRNYLTHYDEKKRDKAKSGSGRMELTLQLRYLIEVCLMLEMGIPLAKVEELVKRNQRIRQLF